MTINAFLDCFDWFFFSNSVWKAVCVINQKDCIFRVFKIFGYFHIVLYWFEMPFEEKCMEKQVLINFCRQIQVKKSGLFRGTSNAFKIDIRHFDLLLVISGHYKIINQILGVRIILIIYCQTISSLFCCFFLKFLS